VFDLLETVGDPADRWLDGERREELGEGDRLG
jgi:hypothetical protein